MNLYVELFAMILELLVILFYVLNRNNIIKFNVPIMLINLFILLSIVFDLISVFLLKNQNLKWLGYFFSYLYLLSIILVTYFFAIYIISQIIFKDNISKKHLYLGVTGVAVCYGIAICLLPLDILYKGASQEPYISGLAANATYLGGIIILLFDLGLIIIKSKDINSRVKKGIIIYQIIWYIAGFFQIFIDFFVKPNDVIYFIGLAESIGSLVIYSLLDNPSINIDPISGAMNKESFNSYISRIYKKNSDKELAIFIFDKNNIESLDHINDISLKIGDILRQFNGKVFKYGDSVFMLIKSKEENSVLAPEIDKLIIKFRSKYKEYSELKYKVFTISSIFKFESSDELTKSIPFFIADNKKEYSNFVSEIDQKRIDYIKYKMNISELVDYSIENDSIAIEYQPIYSIKEKRFTSAEALVRLIDKNGNIIYPQAFIDMVENDERIIPMGKLVFKHVCEFISKNSLEDLGLKYIEVNLSPAQCRKENFAFDLIEIVKKYHVNPKIINIEITEKAAAKQKDLIFAMERLKEYGFSFSLDDFGTGNSNLNYIVNMPVNIIKFDKTMVDSYFSSEKASKIVSHAIDMVKDLGQEIVFEGIEIKDQVDRIEKLPVDYIQGFYYSKPLGEDKFKALLTSENN